ncbi:MAG: PSD1 and planctomycete cytochrome C domain-containing protein [Limisphaerales bacterium]
MQFSLNSQIALLLVVAGTSVSAAKFSQAQINYFEKQVRPLLADNCYKCHSERFGKFKGGLALDTRAGVLRGGDSGPIFAGKNIKESLLYKAISHTGDVKMPKGGKLTKKQIAVLAKWIRMGAPDPRDKPAVAEVVESTIDVEKGREFWAFQAPKKSAVPQPKQKGWAKNDIDRIVLAKLEAKGIKPNPDANKRSLLRRLYFDLIGLPPSVDEVATFEKDDSPKAVERVVDRLLGSPRFGERWGRHWLDVARFAESNGMERNQLYPHAWRYRDYVLASFNADKPFDLFVREQIAGDHLAKDHPKRRDELMIATGFLALGPKSLNERDKRQFAMDVVDEQIDLATRATMAITVSCARCHDHKFDPISTADYYALAGIFRSTKTQFNLSASQGVRQRTSLIALSKGAVEAEGVSYASPKVKKTSSKQKKKRSRAPTKPTGPVAMGVEDGDVNDCQIHIRGDIGKLGPVVARGIPAVMRNEDTPQMPAGASGRRELADWLVCKDNPLTARVFVNRAWHHLFGRGIVRTADNFGETGARPSNQVLLDYLAIQFMENDWSVKQLVKSIVMSRTYQLASTPNPVNSEIDGANEFYWKANHRRLDAESIRDAILAVSGELDLDPPTGSVVAKLGEAQIDRNVKQMAMVKAAQTYRSVYLPVVRNNVDDMMRTFDFAEPSMIVGRRSVTTVPSQALFLLNSKFMLRQSGKLAEQILDDSSLTRRERVGRIYRQMLNRRPSNLEAARALDFIKACATGNQDEVEAWAGLCQAIFGSAEFRYLD